VEFAIIGSLLFTMLLGTVDFALAFSNQMMIRAAVAEGGYFIAQNPGNTAGAEARVLSELEGLPDATEPGRLEVHFSSTGCSGGYEDTSVTVQYVHRFLFASVLRQAEITLESSTTLPQFGTCQG
jgi:hypothetical protein